jgi:adenine-specific DNA-methyltransferase
MTDNNLQKKVAELEAQIRKLKKSNLGLVFEDKTEDVVEQTKVKAPVLKEFVKKRLDLSEEYPNNLMIEGDNYLALSVLNYTHKGKIDLIYIDPPYNTGNKDFIYDDNYVDREDGYRHSKWLSYMRNRLVLSRELLKKSGAIFISIDDNEQARLRVLCDKIFGESNFVVNIVWQKKYTQSNDAKFFSTTHDYILCYAKDISEFKINLLNRSEDQEARYSNPDNDPRGPWASQPIQVKTPSKAGLYEIVTPAGKKFNPPRGRSWQFSRDKYEELVKENRIWFGENGMNVPRIKKFLSEVKDGVIPKTIWLYNEVGSNYDAKRTLKDIVPERSFDSPKPVSLIEHIIKLSSDENALILDYMAGSGTTGHAVLSLNAKDGGSRRLHHQLGHDNASSSGYRADAESRYRYFEAWRELAYASQSRCRYSVAILRERSHETQDQL